MTPTNLCCSGGATNSKTSAILEFGSQTMWHDGNQNNGMFFPGLLTKFWQKIKIELSFFIDILSPEQVKRLVHSVHESAPFYLT